MKNNKSMENSIVICINPFDYAQKVMINHNGAQEELYSTLDNMPELVSSQASEYSLDQVFITGGSRQYMVKLVDNLKTDAIRNYNLILNITIL